MLKIYGTKRSSAYRCHWLLTELGLEYETKSVDVAGGENKTEAFLQMNPNGKVPVLVDDDFILFESFAINDYLADKHRPELLGSTLSQRALVRQWEAWALANLADPFMTLILQHFRKTPDDADIAAAHAAIDRFLPILDATLAGKEYLVENTFTVADINVSSMVNDQEMTGIDLAKYSNINAWVQKLDARPAVQQLNAA